MSFYNIQWSIEGSVELDLPENATEAEIQRAAKQAVYDLFRGNRGIPEDVNIIDWEKVE